MSLFFNVSPAFFAQVVLAYLVSYSLRFDQSGDFLTSPTLAASNRQTFTLSAWIKPSSLPALYLPVFSGMNVQASPSYNQQIHLGLEGSNLSYFEFNSPSFISYLNTNTTPISVGTWHHVVFAIDTTADSAGDRVKIWLDGSPQSLVLQGGASYYAEDAITFMSAGTWPSSGNEQKLTVGAGHSFLNNTTYRAFPGQIAEVHFIDGTAYDASYFGETRDGVWLPKEVTGVTYGTNGFYLDFADSSTAADLGNDVSGNDNDFSVNGNIAPEDQLIDTPTS